VIEHITPGEDSFGTYCTTEVEAEALVRWMTGHAKGQKVLPRDNSASPRPREPSQLAKADQ
jgi:hypothetical protein